MAFNNVYCTLALKVFLNQPFMSVVAVEGLEISYLTYLN